MADNDQPIPHSEGPKTIYRTAGDSTMVSDEVTEVGTTHRWIEWDWNLTLILFVLVFLPPLVTWWIAASWTLLSGFLGVVIGWLVGAVSTWVGYRAVTSKSIERIVKTHKSDD
jgi:hypothetical protein